MLNPNGVIIKDIAKLGTDQNTGGNRVMAVSSNGDFVIAAGSGSDSTSLGRYNLDGSNQWSINYIVKSL